METTWEKVDGPGISAVVLGSRSVCDTLLSLPLQDKKTSFLWLCVCLVHDSRLPLSRHHDGAHQRYNAASFLSSADSAPPRRSPSHDAAVEAAPWTTTWTGADQRREENTCRNLWRLIPRIRACATWLLSLCIFLLRATGPGRKQHPGHAGQSRDHRPKALSHSETHSY